MISRAYGRIGLDWAGVSWLIIIGGYPNCFCCLYPVGSNYVLFSIIGIIVNTFKKDMKL